MLHQARTKLAEHGNVRFQKHDAYKTDVDGSAFDAVFLVNLLHIVHDPVMVLRECSRVVRNGGKVVVADVTSEGTPLLAGI